MMQFPFGFWKPSTSADLLSGVDGALVLNAGSLSIPAGTIKRYSSISITNASILTITGFPTHGASNPGSAPVIIGCAGNCTIDGSSEITAYAMNAGASEDYYGDKEYSASVVPFDAAINPISYVRYGGYGGAGGESGGYGTIPGYDLGYGVDSAPTGHGGGGGGYLDGGITTDAQLWGTSGEGAASTISGSNVPYLYPTLNGFGSSGEWGYGGEVGSGLSVGGGGSGGLRGLSGGAIFLQIGGTAAISGTINISGQDGGSGGSGGAASSPDDASVGGGGGGGGAGGSGGFLWIYYKSGSVTASVLLDGGLGGSTGVGGIADGPYPTDGYEGTPGADGLAGGSTIATY